MSTIRLLNITPEVAVQVRNAADFERAHGAALGDVADTVRDVVAMNESFRSRTRAPAMWGGYLAIDPAARRVIGTCAFKGAPVDGAVEIAYYTFPPFENNGYASEMARALTELAFASTAVHKVLAHTLPEDSASTAVVEKNGFTRVGEVIDPDDGRVWRWEKRKEPAVLNRTL